MHQDTTDSSIYQSSQLCNACSSLDLETMFCRETKEQSIGPLSDYINPDCLLCNLISKCIGRIWGIGWNSAKLCSETRTPPQLFIQSRSPLFVKENGHMKYPQPRLLLAVNRKPQSFQQKRAVIRGIDRSEARFIIGEIESLSNSSMPLLVRRKVGTYIDAPLVKRWLQDCKHHKHSREAEIQKSKDLFQNENGFRLIDVIDECLVQKTKRCEYVALSYVWGNIPAFQATKENVTRLSDQHSLSPSQSRLKSARIPRTVVDAMEFARNIGIKYLWVDGLCIVQNDEEDKSRLIDSMDDIYDNATLTIIAAVGSDADAGLKGISPREGCSIESTKIVDIPGGSTLNLAICPLSLCEEVRNSTWNTRGWTYQEQCLSQRCLYFTAGEVFFNCSEVQWRESYILEDEKYEDFEVKVRTGPPWWTRQFRKDLDPTPYRYFGNLTNGLDVRDYQTAVQDYTRRKLLYPDDILKAFGGIFNRFKATSELSIIQTQGIPVHFFFQALLWFPSDCSQRRPFSDTQFSTWSWASWIGPIEFVFADSLWLSRTISKAPLKRVPIHVSIICWHYGGSNSRFWSHDAWKAAQKTQIGMVGHVSEELTRTKTYLNERIGINIDILLSQSLLKAPTTLLCGELGFFGAYLPTEEVRILRIKGERFSILEISANYRGEFRFDGDFEEVDEFVIVVAADTISEPPKTQSILLGLVTRNNISMRVGIGFVYYPKKPNILKPRWQYKFFRLR